MSTIANIIGRFDADRYEGESADLIFDMTDEFAEEMTEFETNSPIETIYCDNATALDYRDFDVIVVCFHAEECGI